MLNYDEVSAHQSPDDCWVIIHDKVYDITSFLDKHPGGSAIILKHLGKHANNKFDF